jgi:hypothetical protein
MTEEEKEYKRVKSELHKIMLGNEDKEMPPNVAKMYMRLLNDNIEYNSVDYQYYLKFLKEHSKGGD